MADLKPCPFCGGEAETENHHNRYTDWWEVKCTDCNASLNERYEYEFEAVDAWNTRKPMEAVVAELEIEKERHEKDRTYWSEHSWKDSLMYNECDMSERKADCFETAISIVRGKE